MSGDVYRCASLTCASTFPQRAGDRATDPIGGGWVQVLSRLELNRPGVHRVSLMVQAGFLCPVCVARYIPPQQRSLW